jgi:CPA1 family monovalent cation:H+ antiporter
MSESPFLLLLCAVVFFAIAAKGFKIAYPIIFVIGGLLLAITPGMPTIKLKPDWVFLLFLPPLLFGGGWTTDVRQFKRYLQPIGLLAIGLVIATTLAVTIVAHWILGLPLGIAFVLGAILSPTDAVVTDAITEELSLPRRLATIIGGESLVNDATGLVLYRFGVAAAMTGTFSLAAISLQFLYVAVAGIAVGIAIAHLVFRLQMFLNTRRLSDDLITVALSLITPFLLYIPADAIGASGVLAAVTGGMYLSQKAPRMFGPSARIAASGVWDLLFFILNGTAFILTGLQLRSVLPALTRHPPGVLLGYGVIIAITLTAIRFLWIFPISRLRSALDPHMHEREGPPPSRRALFILSWGGMRGIVSLAAALALPITIENGAPFPQRDLLIFITFVVILVSLLVQGLTLPHFIRGLESSEEEVGEMIARARIQAAGAALRRLISLETSFDSIAHWQVAGYLRTEYEQRITHYHTHLDGSPLDEDTMQHVIDRELRREMYVAERQALTEMRRNGEITDDLFRILEREVDLAESRYVSMPDAG